MVKELPGHSGAPVLRRAFLALAAVAALGLLVAGLQWKARHSPYRGRLTARSPVVEVARGGVTVPVKVLEVLEVRAGDVVRTSADGSAVLGLSGGAEAVILGGSDVLIGPGPDELELRAGKLRLRAASGSTAALVLSGKRWVLRSGRIEAHPGGLEPLEGPAELLDPSGSPLRLPR